MKRFSAEVVVIGAGPAGIAAAARAAEAGARTLVIDDNPAPGGQIWRRVNTGSAAAWKARLAGSGAQILHGVTIAQQPAPGVLLGIDGRAEILVDYDSLILATGARELFLPFPGWTLPGVTGVGGLQALVKSGLDIRGQRVVIAGSGPLLLAVASTLRRHGARVRLIAEQTPARATLGVLSSLVAHPGKLAQAVALKASLLGVPHRLGLWTARAEGTQHVTAAILSNGTRTIKVECDLLAVGFGLVPNTHLAAVLGCAVTAGRVVVDDHLRTSVPSVYAAGETIGIGGVKPAIIEGQIAGLNAAGRPDLADQLRPARARARSFAGILENSLALRQEVLQLAEPGTIVCRCEDVPWSRVSACDSWRDAKLQTRCGMGPCQGRVCGPAIAALTGWTVGDARPPITPTTVGSLSRTLSLSTSAADPPAPSHQIHTEPRDP